MKPIYTLFPILIFLFSLPVPAEEKPEVARLIQGTKKMSDQVIELMDSLKKGADRITYDSHAGYAGYADGGSSGVRLKVNKKATLVIFLPWWQPNDWKDIRLGITKLDESVPDWSRTLEEDAKLKAKVISTLKHLVDRKKLPNIKDRQTELHIISILSRLKITPKK